MIMLGLSCLASIANAIESEEGTKIVEIPLTGGLNTQYNPFTLAASDATISKNIRLDTEYGSLAKRNTVFVYGTVTPSTESITGMHRLYQSDGDKILLVNHGDQIDKGNDSTGSFTKIFDLTSSDHKWQWLTWNDRAIGCDGYNDCVKYDGDATSAAYLGSLNPTPNGVAGNPNGVYAYKVACYSASYYANFNVPSHAISASSEQIALTEIPVCPDTILGETLVSKRIYRTEASGTTFKLVNNYTNTDASIEVDGYIYSNSTTSLVDNTADGSLGADYPSASSASEIMTPPKGKLTLVSNDRLWIFNNPDNPSRAYYSELGNYDIFYDDSYFDIRQSDGDQITCAKNVLGIPTICKNNSIQKIYNEDTDPDNWYVGDPMSFIGNVAMYAAVNTQYGMFYLGNNGLYLFNGQYSQLLSDKVTPQIKDIKPSNLINVWGAYYNNAYYMAYTSSESSQSYNNRVLVYDTIVKAFNIDYINANVLLTLNSSTDVEVLYSGSSTDGKVRAHSDSSKQVSHTAQADFTGTADGVRYIPVDVGGDADSAEFEIAWTATIDSVTSTIDVTEGIIDRPDQDGTYWSQGLNFSATSYDKIYWNETIPATGGDVLFYVRTATSESALATASWSSALTTPTGSDISTITANDWFQYKFYMTTDSISYTPTIYEADNYVVKITYNLTGTTDETSIPIVRESGWMDFAPGYNKTLKKFYIYYDWPADTPGTLTVTWTDYNGASDVFAINLQDHPKGYEEYFTTGALLGEAFKMKIEESSLNALKIKKVMVAVDVEPLI